MSPTALQVNLKETKLHFHYSYHVIICCNEFGYRAKRNSWTNHI